MNRYPFKAVIFDMDGVIVDSETFYQEEMRAFGNDIGVEVSDSELNGLVGASHKVFVASLISWLEKAGEGVLSGDEAMERFHTWEQDYPYDYRSLLNPGVRETISTLKERGVRVALASSTRPAGIREVLEACDLIDAFEVIVSGEQFRESNLPAHARPIGSVCTGMLLRGGFCVRHHRRKACRAHRLRQARGTLWLLAGRSRSRHRHHSRLAAVCRIASICDAPT